MNCRWGILATFIWMPAAFAQDGSEFRFDGVHISRGLYDAWGASDDKLRAKPAQLSYTRPAGGDASATIDAGVELVWGHNANFGEWRVNDGLAIGVEQHRNTATTDRQNTVLAGAGAQGLFSGAGDLGWAFAVNTLYRDDRSAGNRGYVANASLAPYVRKKLNAWSDPFNTEAIRIFPTLVFGILYQRVSSSDAALTAEMPDATGSVTQATGIAGVAFKLGAERKWEVGYEFKIWQDMSRSGVFSLGGRTTHIQTAGISYSLDRATSIALQYVDGSDPIEGIVKQRYTQIVLQFNEKFFAGK